METPVGASCLGAGGLRVLPQPRGGCPGTFPGHGEVLSSIRKLGGPCCPSSPNSSLQMGTLLGGCGYEGSSRGWSPGQGVALKALRAGQQRGLPTQRTRAVGPSGLAWSPLSDSSRPLPTLLSSPLHVKARRL